ncbi:MAG: glutathione S-transferase family protein [Rhodospirillaceae bacterium]|nr:glutathione S-transferase family protein [Rhodospirillaceae bacterium]
MIVCVHHSLCAASRALRIQLAEKGLSFDLRAERPWERAPEFLRLNPAGEVPVLLDNAKIIAGGIPALEYVEEVYPEPTLLGSTPEHRAEVRRLVHWFFCKFETEVTRPIVGEKIGKRITGGGAPNSRSISAGRLNIHVHLDYIAWLMERRRWLAGETITLADMAAAAQLSLVDYAGEVPWTRHPEAKGWYARIKSRPSFRPILGDTLSGIYPPKHYVDLDF